MIEIQHILPNLLILLFILWILLHYTMDFLFTFAFYHLLFLITSSIKWFIFPLSWNWASFQETFLLSLFKNMINVFNFINCNSKFGIVSGAIFRITLMLKNSFLLSLFFHFLNKKIDKGKFSSWATMCLSNLLVECRLLGKMFYQVEQLCVEGLELSSFVIFRISLYLFKVTKVLYFLQTLG